MSAKKEPAKPRNTSSKVVFSLAKLKEQALESLDFRIARQREKLENYDSDVDYTARVNAWRRDQLDAIVELAEKIQNGVATDSDIDGFRAKPKPERDRWQNDREKTHLQAMESLRSKVVAKAESLVGDENGNVSLTKTQLAEFFDI